MAAPVYLFEGPEFGERDEAVLTVKKSLKQKFGDIDEHLYFLIESTLGQALSDLQSGNLFSAATCVVVKNAELLKKKEDADMLSQWIKSADESSVLILVSDSISIDAKFEKLIPESNKKQFWEMTADRILSWLMGYFKKNGYVIEEEAAGQILEMVENNTQALKNECYRFFVLFPKNHLITTDDVDSVLTHNREESAFTLFDAISDSNNSDQKRFENGISVLQNIRLSKENSSVMIIAGLSSCFRKLILWQDLNAGGYPADNFELKKNGFGSKKMQAQYRRAAKIWTKGQCMAVLAILASTDMDIRSSGTAMEDVYLQKMLLEIVIKKGHTMSTAPFEM